MSFFDKVFVEIRQIVVVFIILFGVRTFSSFDSRKKISGSNY